MAVRTSPRERGPSPKNGRGDTRRAHRSSEPTEPVCRWNKLLTATDGYVRKIADYQAMNLSECPVVRIKRLRDRLNQVIEAYDAVSAPEVVRPAAGESDSDRPRSKRGDRPRFESLDLHVDLGESEVGEGDGDSL